MQSRLMRWILVIIAICGLSGPIAFADLLGDSAMTYETVEPSRIKLGESATLRVTTLDGYLNGVTLPTVPGLEFEIIGHSQGVEFVNSISMQASYILIKVTPQIVGIFSIPGLTPKSPTVGLEVVSANAPPAPTVRLPKQIPPPAPMSTAPIPKGIQLRVNGAAFVQMVIPSRPVYVGESVPIDIELGVRPDLVTTLNGLPELKGGDFTLKDLSKKPLRREEVINGSPFLIMTWHSALAAIKPGDFSLSVQTPLSVRIDGRSAADIAFSNMLGWPFTQPSNQGSAPKDVTVASPSAALKVLALPAEGRPNDFRGAVGDFQVSSDVSTPQVMAGDPLTLRLHITGVGNFDRVDAPMFDHLDHWKTYPAKSSFTPSDPGGYKGEKVFEQPLIASATGQQSIPSLSFSYFSPTTQKYERAETQPIPVTVSSSLADSSLAGLTDTQSRSAGLKDATRNGLRSDHLLRQRSVSDLRPLYFQARFLVLPATLALVFAGSWIAQRRKAGPAHRRAAERALAELEAAAKRGDAAAFLELARAALLHSFAARWQISPEQITADEFRTRLGAAGPNIDQLWTMAEEAKYSDYEPSAADFQRWTTIVRGQLVGEDA